MERVENSIQDLISALHHNLSRSALPDQSSPFREPVVPPPQQEDNETDEEDDNITRPTAGGTDDSEERTVTLEIVNHRVAGAC